VLVWIQPIDMEAFRSHLRPGVFTALAVFCCPDIVFSIWVVGPYAYCSALSYGLLIPFDRYRSYHGLTSKTKSSGRSVIKSIPLVIDQLDTAVGIVRRIARLQCGSILIQHRSP